MMQYYCIVLLMCFNALIALVICYYIDYSDHCVIKIKPNHSKHLDLLKQLETVHNLDFWTHPHHDLRPILTHLSASQIEVVSHHLNQSNICYEIVSNSLQQMIDKQRAKRSYNTLPDKVFNYESYHSYSEIVEQLKFIGKKKESERVKINAFGIGLTYEKRVIPAISITSSNQNLSKRIVIFECGIHSREWISPAACLWIMNDLITNAANAQRLDKFHFLIVPVLNSDGYDYTWNTDRLWRKSRAVLQNSTCIGVDLNRNWDSQWCAKHGASDDPCANTYCGNSAFSEKESLAMAILVYERKEKIAAYFSLHSYSQRWMYPWGYTKALPPNHQLLHNLSRDAVDAIKSVDGLVYQYGSQSNTLYATTGDSTDWVYDTIGVKIVFALELRDDGVHGFLLPYYRIRQASSEIWLGIKAVIDQI